MIRLCQYNKPKCQRVAAFWHLRKLDFWEFQRNPICANCKGRLEKIVKEVSHE